MVILQNVDYAHPHREILFSNLNFSLLAQGKVALTGDNGTGKSTLLKIVAGDLIPSKGSVSTGARPYYVPQLSGQFKDGSIAQALQVSDKLRALEKILAGDTTTANLNLIGDDWSIEERCKEALSHWQLEGVELNQKMSTLSGGEKTKVLLAGIMVHRPQIILLDEPSNHLDRSGRAILYDFVKQVKTTLIVVSHDKMLLNLPDTIYELSKTGIAAYGGNYNFYATQKMVERDALQQNLRDKEKALRKAKETERQSVERRQKLDARAKKKQPRSGIPTISVNTLRNSAEKSTARMKGLHAGKVDNISRELDQIREALPDINKMKIGFGHSALHRGKVLVGAEEVNFGYDGRLLWQRGLNFQITSGERIAVRGRNGSGKTTLIRLLLGELQPITGKLYRANAKTVYIDQDYSLIDPACSVYEQVQSYNSGSLQEHEIKLRLNRFLFTSRDWDKRCAALSGGEKMRLMLCSLTIGSHLPDIIVLDEPTNNLDIRNMEILTTAVREYQGTLLVISHDDQFLKEIHADRSVFLGE